ncbi:MAG TPA: NUDIX domain-containing protein [Pseudonocardiaceae bacterium]|nr:NUDIX domain-containing protein [Pseudonocardiaceae bacterium]
MPGDGQSTIRCVGAVVVDGARRMLLVQRGQEPGRWRWSLPGGRVEPGETDSQALIREIAEETALTIRPGALFGVVTRPAPAGEYVIYDYACAVVAGVARARSDAADVRWVDQAAFEALDHDGRLVDLLARTLRDWKALPWA